MNSVGRKFGDGSGGAIVRSCNPQVRLRLAMPQYTVQEKPPVSDFFCFLRVFWRQIPILLPEMSTYHFRN